MKVMKELKTLYFKHEYFKLQNEVFPTVRGKSSKYKPEEFLNVVTPSKKFVVQVLSVDYKAIKELTTAFMDLDGTHGEYHVYNYLRFIELLNSFRRFHKIENASETVCVLWLRMVV